jgi:ABC-type lipoprotein export system ATPase subunit/bifunctional DNA-binding transcriptional regulator/antitoxin component of YhaV-PrlF toxin-antitoxin module
VAAPLILCENLIKVYRIGDFEVLALQGLEFSVDAGEMVGIVGVSGSGKTTLLNVLGGLVRPLAGQVIVNGHNLLEMSDKALDRYRRTQIGFLWQAEARNLIPYLNVRENVAFPMSLNGLLGRKAEERARALVDMVGLGSRVEHYLPALSGGEQQRVALAVALANNPTVLLADEPTGELDSVTAQSIYDMLRQLNRELGLTVLIVSHDPGLARQVDRVVAIRDGKTATETVRSQRTLNSENETSDEEHFEELTVIDSAGRLQLPKAYRDILQIGDRARVELVEDAVMIRPAKRKGEQHVKPPVPPSRDTKQPQARSWLRWWRR